jgi:hypothetical protein
LGRRPRRRKYRARRPPSATRPTLMPTPRPVLAPVLSPLDDAADVGLVEVAVPPWTVVPESERLEEVPLIWVVMLVEAVADAELLVVEVLVEFGFILDRLPSGYMK